MEEEEDAQVSDEELSRSMDNGEDVTVASAGPDGSRHKVRSLRTLSSLELLSHTDEYVGIKIVSRVWKSVHQ